MVVGLERLHWLRPRSILTDHTRETRDRRHQQV
jgi:hypothetical protein